MSPWVQSTGVTAGYFPLQLTIDWKLFINPFARNPLLQVGVEVEAHWGEMDGQHVWTVHRRQQSAQRREFDEQWDLFTAMCSAIPRWLGLQQPRRWQPL